MIINSHQRLLLIFLSTFYIFCLKGNLLNAQEDMAKPVSLLEMMSYISAYENILNKKLPSFEDFHYLDPGPENGLMEQYTINDYCAMHHINDDTKECTELTIKLYQNYGRATSLYLLNIKNILTDSKDITIKLYIDPNLRPCSMEETMRRGQSTQINGVALIGSKKYKNIRLGISCDLSMANTSWKVGISEVNGKGIDKYPTTLRLPGEK